MPPAFLQCPCLPWRGKLGPICLFLLLFPIFWEVGHRGSCYDVCRRVFCPFSPLRVLVSGLRTIPRGFSAPKCCAFIKRVIFKEVSGHRVLIKSGPGNRGLSACGTTHVAHLEFPRETSIILRCAGKAGNPFQNTQGNRLSCRDEEGRRGSDEGVPGPSVFPSGRDEPCGWCHMPNDPDFPVRS